MKEILNVIHNTIYQFICGDYKEVPMSDKDELLLQVNKAICNNLEALEQQPCEDCVSRKLILGDYDVYTNDKLVERIKALPPVTPQPQPNIKALGEDMRICQKSITDEKVLIGFNMAVALCNKHLAESEVEK